MASRVVIGYDGSAASEDAIAFGLTWCRSTGDVPINTTVYPGEQPLGSGASTSSGPSTSANKPRSSRTTPWPRSATQRSTATSPSTSAVHGLADLAEDVEAVMVIVGTTQETGLARALLGTSTERLPHGPRCRSRSSRPGGGSQRRIGSPASGWRTWTPATAARRCGWRYGSPCESLPG